MVEDIVEIYEVFVRHSYKGNYSKSTTFKMPREPRKRGKDKNDKNKRGKSIIDSVYHLQHLNSLHSYFKRWLMPFNGASNKYISNYLAWFKFLKLSKNNKKIDRIKDMFVNLATKETCITINAIRNRYIELA